MIKNIIDAIVFLWPIIILIILLVAIAKSIISSVKNAKKNSAQINNDEGDSEIKKEDYTINIPFLLFSIPLKLESKALYYGILSIACFAMIIIFAYRDYSYAYNGTYEYEVFYNDKKIQELISIVKERDSSINIPEDWKSKRKNYLDSIPTNESPFIAEVLLDDKIGDYLHTTGLSVHKTEYFRFFQNYKIEKIEGFLKHEYKPPNEKGTVFTSTYELIPADNNLIEPTFKDFIKGNYISTLKIGQSINCNSEVDYSIPITSLTKSKFFPISKIEFSLFCFEIDDEIIPFAYARYVDE